MNTQPTKTNSPYLTPQQAAILIGCAPISVYRLIYAGLLRASKLGRRTIRMAVGDVEAYMASKAATADRAFVSWTEMHRRCYSPKYHAFKHYGGRGISICLRWHRGTPHAFRNFITDMGERPLGTSIDRINNDARHPLQIPGKNSMGPGTSTGNWTGLLTVSKG